MSMYADSKYYFTEHVGEMQDVKSIELNLLLASCDIDRLTFNRIKRIGFSKLSVEQQDLIKKSCCLQADYINAGSNGNNDNISSYTAGNVSISYDISAKTPSERERFSEDGFRLLKATGLMQRVI
ncbi:MAG: hypothetical protein NC213_10270 [Acetobacter sp.]|nr:hypothetical protein [Bacteroides sp.]MCM1342119.1 hypothetical protein [Acetobacter sp.]MCM1434338.1 hypothetical protein [Clostridiales bacterium]